MSSFELNMQNNASRYRQELIELSSKIPAYEDLKTFVEHSQKLDASPAKISIVRFNESSIPDFADITEDSLANYLKDIHPSTLFVIENISTSIIESLGSQFGVEFEFWLDHINNSSWFRLGDIEKHLPPLKSVQLESKHIRHQFVGPRELLLNTPGLVVDDRIEPEIGSARVPRVAGALNPSRRLPTRSHVKIQLKDRFPSLALTRQHVSMWFDSSKGNNGWKIGMS